LRQLELAAELDELDVKDERRGREAAAFRDLRATGICGSGFRSCAS